MSLVHDEQTRLLANALDWASTACFTMGVATPVAGPLYGIGKFHSVFSPVWLVGMFADWLAASGTPHLIARNILKRLKT